MTFLFPSPDNGEQALEIVESLVRTGKIDVMVIDSVAALTPKDEIEGDMGAYHVGKQARLMSQALRKLTAIVARSKTVRYFYQSNPHANRSDVRQSGNHSGRQRP